MRRGTMRHGPPRPATAPSRPYSPAPPLEVCCRERLTWGSPSTAQCSNEVQQASGVIAHTVMWNEVQAPCSRWSGACKMRRPQVAVADCAVEGQTGRHFLAYSMLGCVTSREDDGSFRVVEVAFHNTRAHPRVPQLHDLYGFTLASLCPEARPFSPSICAVRTVNVRSSATS